MNPILQEALGSILRWLLTGMAGYLVSWGIWTQQDAEKYVAAAVIGLIALGWGLWQKHKSRSKLLVALATPRPMTENEAEAKVKMGQAPPTSISKHVTPCLSPPDRT